jgi:late competence protein required for DNA uptake (superfamily II DNA/RNA helicase)
MNCATDGEPATTKGRVNHPTLKEDSMTCAICGKPATLFSPSGRPESVYCDAHGHCSRCKTSVEKFVKYPYGDFYACPCVVKFARQQQYEEEMKQAKQVALF